MFSNFQHRLAISPTSLHTISVIVVIAWIVIGASNPVTYDSHLSIWMMLPDWVRHAGFMNTVLAILTSVICIYVLGELNISQVLLRTNSRVISIIFAALISACTFIHAFHPGLVLMFFVLMSYFTLLSTYQIENSAGLSFVTFLYLGICTIIYPKMIWMAPVYWLSLYMLQTVSPRSICASILGLLTPLWIVGGVAYCLGRMGGFIEILDQMISFKWGGYTQHTTSQTMMIWLVFIIFLVSVVDFYSRVYLDKNRTRVIYNVLILHGFALFLLLLLQPISVTTLLPVVLISTSIMGGHYVANDDTPLSNIIVCIFTVFILIAFVLNAWIL